jgi:hypothetical protein
MHASEWKGEIKRRLVRLTLAPAREAAIVEELAQHLEDHYMESLARGATPEYAYRAALAELSDRELLARELQSIERHVNDVSRPEATRQSGRSDGRVTPRLKR